MISRAFGYRRWPWVVALLVVGAGIALAVYLLTDSDGGETVTVQSPTAAPFTVDRPSGWEELSAAQIAALPGQPIAVLKNTDGAGIVSIAVESRSKATLAQLSNQLESKLSGEFSDFKLINAQNVKVPAGQALSISYARTKKGTANTLLAVPTDQGLYVLNAVVPAGQQEAAQEAGSILRSFDL